MNQNHGVFDIIMFMTILKPLFKWVGGKRRLLPVLHEHMPASDSYDRYVEPFLGSGALLLSLKPAHAIVSDANIELINAINAIKTDCNAVIRQYDEWDNSKEMFETIRNMDRDDDFNDMDSIIRAARFMYLNKLAFNGLWRVNADGYYNSAYSYLERKPSLDIANIHAVADYLNTADVQILHDDAFNVINECNGDDFIYVDPPYDPVSETAMFVKYTKTGFNKDKQRELAKLLAMKSNDGAVIMESNADTDYIRELYADWNVDMVNVKRSIAADVSSRKDATEVIITNYKPKSWKSSLFD